MSLFYNESAAFNNIQGSGLRKSPETAEWTESTNTATSCYASPTRRFAKKRVSVSCVTLTKIVLFDMYVGIWIPLSTADVRGTPEARATGETKTVRVVAINIIPTLMVAYPM